MIRKKNSKNKTKPKFIIFILLLSLTIVLFAGAASAASTIYVNGTGGNDTWDGASPTHTNGTTGPKLSIGNATGTASSGDTVKIADGTYKGPNNRNMTINKNMTIIGQSQSGTIIDGEKQDRIFTINSKVTVTLKNLTLTNGNATEYGGAIYNNGILTVTGSIFTNNIANFDDDNNGYGGAIFTEGTLIVTNSNFTGNSAPNGGIGGAIYNNRGNLTVMGSNFTGNAASYGGAIDSYVGNLNVTGSTFTQNTGKSYGGAIFSMEGNLTVTKSNFTQNKAPGFNGGAITNANGNLTVTGSTFTGNTAQYRGGAIYTQSGTSTVTDSTFTGNTAAYSGGAIDNGLGNLTVANTTFIGNSAKQYGGAIFNLEGNANLNFNRFLSNTAGQGSAIYCSNGTVDATNNWWGSNTNPAKIFNLIAVDEGSVDADPWIVLTVKSNLSSLQVGGKSTITVDLLHDSNGVYHNPKNGHVPYGLPVTYTATHGTINPTSGALVNNSATSAFTADHSGVAMVTAKVDNQTVSTPVMIGSTKTIVDKVTGYAGQNVTLKATVTGSTVNEGQVKFLVNNITTGTANVKNGVATLNWEAPITWKPNTYTITANYLGTSKYMASNGTGTFTLKPFPNIAYWQSISSGTHYYGDTIHYYINVENHGPETVGVSVYSKLPSGLRYVSSSANRGSYKSNTWNIGTLKKGQTAKLDIKAVVNKVGWITVKSTVTISTWKGPYCMGTNSFDVPKAVPYAQLLKASKDIKNYYETHNNKLPTSLKVAGQTLTMAQLLKLFTTATINFSKNNKTPLSVTAVGKAPSPEGIYTSGALYNYLSVARNINTFINSKKRAPNYAQTRLGKIPFSKLVYMYAKVVNFYGQNKRLPNYVATYKI